MLAISFARIHQQNLINFGILPLTFMNPQDYQAIDQADELVFTDLRDALKHAKVIGVTNKTKDKRLACRYPMSPREIEVVLQGSLLAVVRQRQRSQAMERELTGPVSVQG